MDKLLRDLQNEILDKIKGKITLTLRDEERKSIVTDALSDIHSDLESRFKFEKTEALRDGRNREKFVEDFLSLSMIEDLLCEPDVEDIIINSLSPIFAHTLSRGLINTDRKFLSFQDLDIFVKKLIIFSGKTELRKVNDLELPNMGGRVNIILSPLGPQITITKIKEDPLSIIDLIDEGTLDFDMAAQLWLYVEGFLALPANIIISGGTGSGKSTFLNAILGFLPRNERLVIIEDTLELNTKFAENCSRLESSESLTMADLVKNSLRMRPDRIIIGEVRGKEARGLMTAMNVGKYCMGTMHAGDARETILRLQNEPMNIPESLVGLINVFIIMRKYSIRGECIRVVHEICETAGIQERKVLLSYLWEYDLQGRRFINTAPSSVHRDKLAALCSISPRRVMEEVATRSKILRAIKKEGINNIREVSQICEEYRLNPKDFLSKFKI